MRANVGRAATDARVRICSALGRLARVAPPFRGKARLLRELCRRIVGRDGWCEALVLMDSGARLLLDPRSRTESGPYCNGSFDADDLDFFRCCLVAGGVALDVGANVGLIAVPLGLRVRELSGALIAFEPVAANAARLRRNLVANELDGVARVMELALSDRECTMRIGRENGGGAATGNAYLEPSAGKAGVALDWTTVRVRRLDDVCDELRLQRMDLVKIDVEGAELGVLRGGTRAIERFRPIIYGEFNGPLMAGFGESFADVEPWARSLDYGAFAFAGRLRLVPVGFSPGRGNAVLCPREKRDWLRARCREARRGPRASCWRPVPC